MTVEQDIRQRSLAIYDPAFKLLSGRPQPEFMLIGAAKSGTTSLSSYLPLHPQLAECVPKEPNFWSWQLCNRSQYQQLFVNNNPAIQPSPGQQIGGEYSTSYLLHPLVPRRVRARLPELKIIVLLRNPIDRAYSHYVMADRQNSSYGCSFDELVEKEIEEVPALLAAHQRGFLSADFRAGAHRSLADGTPIRVVEHCREWPKYSLASEQDLFRFYTTSCVFRSIYHDQLWRWLQLYPKQQLKIIESEKLLYDRQNTLNEVAQFLGLAPIDFDSNDIEHTWGGGDNKYNTPLDYTPMKAETRRRLKLFFAPYNASLFELIGEQYDWDNVI